MVWACGKNGSLPYGQKGVDGQSQWGTGTRETEVRLDGWCEGGLRQQRNDGGGCTTMRCGIRHMTYIFILYILLTLVIINFSSHFIKLILAFFL